MQHMKVSPKDLFNPNEATDQGTCYRYHNVIYWKGKRIQTLVERRYIIADIHAVMFLYAEWTS